MSFCAPKTGVANTTFRNETVNMWIPFQVTTESMKDEDESGSEIFGFIVFKEQAKNNTLNSFEEKRKKISIFEKEMSEFRVNGKDTVTMVRIEYLKRHGSSTVNGVLGSARWTETAVATERNEFESTAFTTTVHCTTKRRITAVNHSINVFDDRLTRVQSIKHFFIMIFENIL